MGLFAAGVIVCLLQVWLPEYYLTGDGPCHVYNARILHDVWSGKNVDFYLRYMDLMKSPNPNWLTHLLLVGLMYIVNGVVAEKLLLSIYIMLFCTGAFLLLRKLSGRASYWPLVLFVFVFHHPLSKGFYNFSLSLAFFFFVVYAWLHYRERRKTAYLLLFFLFTILCFFTHPVAYVISGVVCFGLVLSFAYSSSDTARGKNIGVQTLVLFLCYLPTILLLLHFAAGFGGGFKLEPQLQKVWSFLYFSYLVNIMQSEAFFAGAVGLMFVGLCLVAVVFAFTRKQLMHRYDGFFYALIIVGLMYLLFPDWMFSGGLLNMRLQLFVFLLICCVLAYRFPLPTFSTAFTTAFGLCFLVLTVIRTRGQIVASRAADDCMSAAKYIKPYSSLLPLYLNKNGLDEHGNEVARRNWLFTHFADYMGDQKPLLFLNNYEANTGYFPLVWKGGNINPFQYLGKDASIIDIPPYAEIANYTKNGGPVVDYVLIWCFDPKFLRYERFASFWAEINTLYRPVYTSPTGHTILYERKGL